MLMQKRRVLIAGMIGALFLVPFIYWLQFYLQGKRFARRDKLQKADVIVVLAGTRGNLKFLDGKIATAVKLYQAGWAPYIIGSGKFSVKVTETPELIPLEDLLLAVTKGRIQQKDVQGAREKWDIGLGARYICEKAVQLGVPPQSILTEGESLHTRENAEYILEILKQHGMQRIILVASFSIIYIKQRTFIEITYEVISNISVPGKDRDPQVLLH